MSETKNKTLYINGERKTTIKKIAHYAFARHFLSMSEKDKEVTIIVGEDANEVEMVRFEKYWGVKVKKVR